MLHQKLQLIDYKKEMLKYTTAEKLEKWLHDNPPPASWYGCKYSWAYTEMTIFEM